MSMEPYCPVPGGAGRPRERKMRPLVNCEITALRQLKNRDFWRQDHRSWKAQGGWRMKATIASRLVNEGLARIVNPAPGNQLRQAVLKITIKGQDFLRECPE